MTEIKNIVVPYDFSKRCRAASWHAVALAERFHAAVTLLHVIPFSSFEYAAFEGGAYVGTAWPSETEIISEFISPASVVPSLAMSTNMSPAVPSS